MKKDLKYFMREQKEEIVTAPGPESFKDENGNVIEFEIRVLTQEKLDQINELYRNRSIATDKRGTPYVKNGEAIWKVDKSTSKAVNHIIAEALVFPDLKDKDLMAYYKCVDITEMPMKVFSKPSEYAHVVDIVFTALGFGEAEDEDKKYESDLEEAKN